MELAVARSVPPGYLSVSAVRAVRVGANLPCTHPDHVTTTYVSQDQNETFSSAVCWLGQLNNMATEGEIVQEDNEVCLSCSIQNHMLANSQLRNMMGTRQINALIFSTLSPSSHFF